MNCINCGAFLTDTDLDYCPHCGANVLIQKKVDYLSKLYYNQGLEKASIRDLSGAISCLKQSLAYDKRNIRARNLLGLVYFETGEVVAALSEWVISKNIQKNRNLASEYIAKLQANQNKLDTINESIKKYNNALAMCREGHEDMAAIRLKKILSQNPKLIKGYHLLALIQMKNQEWNKARRTLKKAARIDKTNTTTLRFLREVDEQTGVTTKIEKKRKGLFGNEKAENDNISGEIVVRPSSYKERSRVSLFFTMVLGFAAGAAAFWLLVLPAVKQDIYREANQQIIQYSDSLSSQSVELTKAQGEAAESNDTADAVSKQVEEEKKRSQSYEALFSAYTAMQQEDLDTAALQIQNVYVDTLSDSAKGVYNTICERTGVSGISSSDSTDSTGDSSTDSTGSTDNAEGADSTQSAQGDSGNYDDSGDYSDEYSSYDESGYDDSSYNDGYTEKNIQGNTSEKGNVLRYIPLFVFARKGIKIEKRGKNKMAAGFERSGTVLTVHLPTELDHPVSDEIRRESDRIIGHEYIKNMIFDFSETVFMDSSGIGLLMGRYRALGMRGKCVQVMNVNSHIAKLLRLSGVGRYIDICKTQEAAEEQEGVYHGKHK